MRDNTFLTLIRDKFKAYLKGRWFIFYQRKVEGQTATLFILLIAVILILTAITMNIGKVSEIKTTLDNAADGAAMAAASNLGSIANVYNRQTGSTTDYTGIIKSIVAIGITIFNPPLGLLALGANLAIEGYKSYQLNKVPRLLSSLSGINQIKETAINYALFSIVVDPNMITDYHDLDEDGEVDDEVSQFLNWYTQRVGLLEEDDDEAGINALYDVADAKQALLDFIGTPEIPGPVRDFNETIDDILDNEREANPFGTYDYVTLLKDDLVALAQNLMQLYYDDPDTYWVIPEKLLKEWGDPNDEGFWREGDCNFDFENPSPGCDDLDLFVFDLRRLNILLSEMIRLSEQLWVRPAGLVALLRSELEEGDCFDHPIKAWYKRFNCWHGQLLKMYFRLNAILNSTTPEGDPLFPTRDWCRENACPEEPCIEEADAYCEPVADNDPECRALCESVANDLCTRRIDFICPARAEQEANRVCTTHMDRDTATKCALPCCQEIVCEDDNYPYDYLNDRVHPCWVQCAISGPCSDDSGGPSHCFELLNPSCYDGVYEQTYNQCYDQLWDFCLNDEYGNCVNGDPDPWNPEPPNPEYLQCREQAFSDCQSSPEWEDIKEACIQRCIDECYNPLRDEVERIRNRLVNLMRAMVDFRMDIAEVTDTINKALANFEVTPGEAVYAWKDSLGWHLAMVEMSPFIMPFLRHSVDEFLWIPYRETTSLHCGSEEIAVRVWRYDQAKEAKFAGDSNIPLWNFRYGRETDVTEPEFMNDESLKNWGDLELLSERGPGSYRQQIKDFIKASGQRSYSRVQYGPNAIHIRITDTKWKYDNPPLCADRP